MLQIASILKVSGYTGKLIHEYLTGAAWWAWMIDAGMIVAGIVSGSVATLMKEAAKMGLRRAIAGLSARQAIAL